MPPGDGVPPPADLIYFPVSLSVSASGGHLFIVNSDFDLQYAQGTIQSLSVERIRDVSQVPCSTDSDCSGGKICDAEPTEENDESPSFFCVDSSGVPCKGAGEKSSQDLALAPGRCAPIDLLDPYDGGDSLLVDSAETSAFATQGILLQRPCLVGEDLEACAEDAAPGERVEDRDGQRHPERMFFPVRGDTTVHYVDIDADGKFVCGRLSESGIDNGGSLRCSEKYRFSAGQTFGLDADGTVVGTSRPPDPTVDDEEEVEESDPIASFRLPPEPLELDASDDGRVIVVTHQLGGYASTVLNSWTRPPELIHILDGLGDNPIGVAALPESDAAAAGNQPGFLVTYRTDARVDLLRFADDGLVEATSPAGPSEAQIAAGEKVFRPQLLNVASSTITLNTRGFHSRGAIVDDSRQKVATSACAGDADCIQAAQLIPLDVYVANREPNSLLVGRTSGEDPEARISALPQFYDNVPLTAGPSRIVLGKVMTPAGQRELRIFVLCFDSALVYVYDPARRMVEAEIRTGRGPYSMAFDEETSTAFIGHFTDSYVAVVSLDQRHPMTFGATLATLGDPEPPRASQ